MNRDDNTKDDGLWLGDFYKWLRLRHATSSRRRNDGVTSMTTGKAVWQTVSHRRFDSSLQLIWLIECDTQWCRGRRGCISVASAYESWNEPFASARNVKARLDSLFRKPRGAAEFPSRYLPGKIALGSLAITLLFALCSVAFRSLAKATYVRHFDPPRSSM